jgi:hypothetical protein
MRCSSGLEECSTISGVPWIRTGSRWTSSCRSAGDGAAAKCFFRRLLKDLPYKPKRLITDGLRSYGVARRALLPVRQTPDQPIPEQSGAGFPLGGRHHLRSFATTTSPQC